MAFLIPKSFINDLLAQCDIVELINYLNIPLRKQGSNYVALCPFHTESTPSFTVSPSKQIYHCFGECGTGGNAISFIMAYEKLEFIPAIEWLAHHLQLKIPKSTSSHTISTHRLQDLYTSMEDAVAFYQTQLAHTPLALDYLKKRGLTEASIQKFKLGFAPASWDSLLKFLTHQKKHNLLAIKTAGLVIQKNQSHYYDRFRSRIIFPIRDKQGRCIGLGGRVLNPADEPKYLNSPETPIFHKSRELYGLYENCIAEQNIQRVWIVEGYLDVIMLQQYGIPHVMATLGTATSRIHLQQLFRLTEEVVFCFDGDSAGKQAAIRALELSLANIQDDWVIRFLLLPPGEDPDSWIRQSNTTAWEDLLSQTLSLEDFLFQHIQQDINLQTSDGQRMLLKKAIPLFKKMPPNIRQAQLFQRLSRLVNIEVTKLHYLPRPAYGSKQTKQSQRTETYTTSDRAIGLLLQYPKVLAPHLPTLLNDRFQAEYPLLRQLIHMIRQANDVNTAFLLEQFRNESSLLPHLIKLAQYNWLTPSDGVVSEFQDILTHLDRLRRNRQIEAFIEKARRTILTVEEKNQLTQLLSERTKAYKEEMKKER